jgi:hypothetical protein
VSGLKSPFLVDKAGRVVFDLDLITDDELGRLIFVLERERERRVAKAAGPLRRVELSALWKPALPKKAGGVRDSETYKKI